MKSIAYVLIAVLAAAPLSAQSWNGNTEDSGSLLFGWTRVVGGTLGFGCTAPSPQGLSLMETGSHESHRTDPFEMTVTFDDTLFDWQPPYVIEGIVMSVDDVGYALPPLQLNELQGSAIYLPMTDQMILSLLEAQRLVVDTGQGTAYEYPVDGLSQALTEVMGYCNARWVEMGNPLPAGLAAGSAPAPTTPLGDIPPSVIAAAGQGCPNETIQITRDQLQIADMDEDGVEDFLLNHGTVQCTNALNMFCGAANCSIDVFLSTQGYAQNDAFLGIGAELVPLEMGRTGIQIAGTYSLCGETGLCPGPVVWTGASFELNSPPVAPPATTPQEAPQFLVDRVAAGCSAVGFVIDHAVAFGQADFDQDGQLDYVFNGAGVRCYEGINPFCGASQCSVDIHLSSRDYAIVDGYIGMDFQIQTAADGRPGLILNRDATQPLSVWDGSAFVPAPAAAQAPQQGPKE